MKKTLLAMGLALGISGVAFAGGATFEDADLNSDGKISRDEAAKVEGMDFADADTDDDGWLSRSEFVGAGQPAIAPGDAGGSTRDSGGSTHGADVPGDPIR